MDTCCCNSSPLAAAMPLNFYLYDSGPLQVAVPLLEPRVNAVTEILCAGPSREPSPSHQGRWNPC